MAKGIKAPGTWIPGTKAGVVVESKYVKGGYITVDSIEERDRLLRETDVVTPGTKIFVKNTDAEYIYVEHVAGETGEFQSTVENTIQNVRDAGFVTNNQVTTIFEEQAPSIVEQTVNEILPNEVDKRVDAKLEVLTDDIAKEATEIAKEEAVKQVEQTIEADYVKDTKLQETVNPIKSDVSSLQEKSVEVEAKVEQNVESINNVTNTVTELSNNLNDNYYNKADVDAKITGVYHYKGSIATYENLPTENLEVGDVYNVESSGMNYAWTGEGWDNLGQLFNVEEYYKKGELYTRSETDNKINAKLTDYTTTEDLNRELDSKASVEQLNQQIQDVKDAIASDLAYGEF